jgi:phosphoribosylaminoimidazole-succinocarboxamide synthase
VDREWSVGELAAEVGVSVRTLHHYDEIGLLAPRRRTRAGHRRYAQPDVTRLAQIVAMRSIGVSIDDIQSCLDGGEDLAETLGRQLARLEADVAAATRLLDHLRAVVSQLRNGRDVPPADLIRLTEETAMRTPTFFNAGKVRDIYDAGDGLLLFVASDRLSVFDVVLDETVPDKGRVLTAMSTFWFDELADVLPNHVVATEVPDLPDEWLGRVTLARRAEMLGIECIVRGYLTGSAWKEYQAAGTMNGVPLPPGLQESEQLPEPVFTPSTKAELGEHDVNISFEDACEIVGADVAAQAREASLELYRRGAARALERGIVIADTKFELGFVDGELVLADEVLTQDSSRFWPADQVTPGRTPPSFDKQPVRDFAESLGWDKRPPAPPIPAEVIAATRTRYIEAYERITGLSFAAWPGGV